MWLRGPEPGALARDVVRLAREQRVLLLTAGTDVVRVVPSLVVGEAEVAAEVHAGRVVSVVTPLLFQTPSYNVVRLFCYTV